MPTIDPTTKQPIEESTPSRPNPTAPPPPTTNNSNPGPPTEPDGLPPRGRGVSRAVAEVLTATGQPVKATLAGCRMAGRFHFELGLGWVLGAGCVWGGGCMHPPTQPTNHTTHTHTLARK